VPLLCQLCKLGFEKKRVARKIGTLPFTHGAPAVCWFGRECKQSLALAAGGRRRQKDLERSVISLDDEVLFMVYFIPNTS